jgi:hypothetical protein
MRLHAECVAVASGANHLDHLLKVAMADRFLCKHRLHGPSNIQPWYSASNGLRVLHHRATVLLWRGVGRSRAPDDEPITDDIVLWEQVTPVITVQNRIVSNAAHHPSVT